ncbi:hypothetical protein DERP_000146 [Dermatophagoides pteronyssinus]|uniref:Uncharacterized protein n=1 Tax=Dermatophagoides pteronyssinus TaxID=6956 RepID=A0ABQ8IZC9_DERPT|nr:hypothetical protein DERP_000146 [Dermatophagoides pteronyssinus]
MASKSTIKFWSTTTYNRFQSSIYLSCLLIVYLSSSFVKNNKTIDFLSTIYIFRPRQTLFSTTYFVTLGTAHK